MRIAHAEIACFRALEAVSVPLNQFSVLIGENDVGKTSFLHALDKFFANKKLDDRADWFKQEPAQPIHIALTFRDLPADEQLVPLMRQDGSVVISKLFEYDTAPVGKAILDDGSAVPIPKPVLVRYFSSDGFHFIPVRRDLAVQFSMAKTALLGKTLRARLKQVLDAGGGADSLETLKSTLSSGLEEPRDTLQRYLREQLHNEAIRLAFDDLDVDPIEGVSFVIRLSDEKVNSIGIQNRGAGTQNNLIIALFRLIAQLDLGGKLIFAMEEPENSLHPKAQRQLLSVIQQISRENQVIVTTHSPVFIDRSKFENNILLTRTPAGNTISKTFDLSELKAIRADLGIRASDALLKGGGNCAILVEGSTEEDGFPTFLEMLGLSEFQLGIAIVNLRGSDYDRVASTARLLKAYDIPCVVVLDRDAESTAADIQRAAERGELTNVRNVFCLSRGTIEDYYPLDVVAQVINENLTPDSPVREDEFDSDKHGEQRLKDFQRVMYEHNAGSSIEFLKSLLGSSGTKILQQRGDPIDPELVAVFQAALEIVEQ
jgi:hypothetical protein